METGAVLIGLAQIGVALAGFTTIASVVVNTSVTTSRNLFTVRILSVLLFSTSLTLAALAPILVNAADIAGTRMWQMSAILIQPWILFFAFVGFFYLNPRVLKDEKNNWIQTILSNLTGTAAGITLIAAIFSEQSRFLYMLSLMLVLLGAILMITSLILSFPVFEKLFVKPEPESSEKSVVE